MELLEKLEAVRTQIGYRETTLSKKLINSPSLYVSIRAGRTRGLSETALDRLFGELGVSSEWWFEESGPVLKKDRLPAPAAMREIPLLGSIPAGVPAEAIEHADEYIHLPARLLRRNSRPLYALRVRGESMTGAHIVEGDIAVLEFVDDWGNQVRTRDIVAALVDGAATLKRLYRKDHTVILRPENPAFADIVLHGEQCTAIRGKLVYLLRSYVDKLDEE